MHYPVVIHKDPDSDYGVTVPDLPGCFSAGETLDEALDMAKEAVETHIEGLLLDGDPLPDPLELESHLANPDYSDAALWAVVDVDLSKLSGKSQRINVTIPDLFLRQIDEHVHTHDMTRSGLFLQGALAEIKKANEKAEGLVDAIQQSAAEHTKAGKKVARKKPASKKPAARKEVA